MSLEKIEVKTGNYLEQVKFIFKDGKKKVIGSNKGKIEKLIPIMTTNEYIVKISHEIYNSNYSIGIGITLSPIREGTSISIPSPYQLNWNQR